MIKRSFVIVDQVVVFIVTGVDAVLMLKVLLFLQVEEMFDVG
jgi:hypothetical protein